MWPGEAAQGQPAHHSPFLPPAGAFCIPLYVPYVLTGRWPFSRVLCKLWLVVDYLLCTSSVFNIVLISYDRFLSVTRAVRDVMPGTCAGQSRGWGPKRWALLAERPGTRCSQPSHWLLSAAGGCCL